MKSKVTYILWLALMFGGAVNAQLNDYKYIIVPKKFEEFRSENQYQTSTLIKYYFEENGFNAIYDDEMPVDLAADKCLGLTADLVDESTMFSTKLSIALIDCKNQEVFRSLEAKNRIKEYKDAYRDAIQNTFVSFTGLNYTYEPKEEVEEPATIVVSFRDDVKSVKEESTEHVLEQKATTEEQVYKSIEPKPTDMVRETNPNRAEENVDLPEGMLYAQPIANGYQLVDSTPKVVLRLESTSMDNVFITTYQGNNAVVFEKDGKWLMEYSDNGQKVQKELQIKF
jgi:hypothetical protein